MAITTHAKASNENSSLNMDQLTNKIKNPINFKMVPPVIVSVLLGMDCV